MDHITLYTLPIEGQNDYFVFAPGADLGDYDSDGLVVWQFDNLPVNLGSKIRMGDVIASFSLKPNANSLRYDENQYALAADLAFAIVHCEAYRHGVYQPGVGLDAYKWDAEVKNPKLDNWQEFGRTLLRTYVYRSDVPITVDAVGSQLEALKKRKLEKASGTAPPHEEN